MGRFFVFNLKTQHYLAKGIQYFKYLQKMAFRFFSKRNKENDSIDTFMMNMHFYLSYGQ